METYLAIIQYMNRYIFKKTFSKKRKTKQMKLNMRKEWFLTPI